MLAHKTQSKQAPKAQPFIASLLGGIKKDSAKSPSPTLSLSGAQMPPRLSTSSPSSSTSGAGASHDVRATSPSSESASSKTLSRVSSLTTEERRNTTAARQLSIERSEPETSLKTRSLGCATSRATPAARSRKSDEYHRLGTSHSSDDRSADTAALLRPLKSHEPQVSLKYGYPDSDCRTPSVTAKTSRDSRRSVSGSPGRLTSEDRDTTGSLRYSSLSEDGECSPPHPRRSSTPTGDFYRPKAYSRSPRGGYQNSHDDDASRPHANHSTAGEPQRRKADTYRPRQQSPAEQQHSERIAQVVAQSLSANLSQLQQRRGNRPKKILRDNKGRPILAKYRKDNTVSHEQPESATHMPKEASKHALTKTTSKVKRIKTADAEDDQRRDSGVDLSKISAALSGPSTNTRAAGKKSRLSRSKEVTPRHADDEVSKKPALSKKRARPAEDLNQGGSTDQTTEKTKLSKEEIVQENNESRSAATDKPQDAGTVASARKKLVPRKPSPSKRKTTAEVAEGAALSSVPKASRKRKPDEPEGSSSSDSSSVDDTPLIQLRPAKKQKEEQAVATEDGSARSEQSPLEDAEETAMESKAARKIATAKKQPRGIPAEERVKGVAYIKLDEGTYMKKERQRKVGTTKPKPKTTASSYSRFVKG